MGLKLGRDIEEWEHCTPTEEQLKYIPPIPDHCVRYSYKKPTGARIHVSGVPEGVASEEKIQKFYDECALMIAVAVARKQAEKIL